MGPRAAELERLTARVVEVDDVAKFSVLLDDLRRLTGQSVRSLASSCNISRSTVSGMTTGRQLPRLDTLKLFLGGCGLPAETWQPWIDAHGRIERQRESGSRIPIQTRRLPADSDVGREVLTTLINEFLELAEHLVRVEDFENAHSILEPLAVACRRACGQADTVTLHCVELLATALAGQGDLDEARTLYEGIFEVRRETLGLDHRETLISQNNVATALADLGDVDEALVMHNEVLRRRAELFGEDDDDTLYSRDSIANLLFREGDLDGARRLHEANFRVRQGRYGDQHEDTRFSRAELDKIESATPGT